MTVEECMKRVCKKYKGLYPRSCVDFGKFYLFSMAPFHITDDDTYDTGRILPAVRKSDGKVFEYDITSDLDAFEAAKKIF